MRTSPYGIDLREKVIKYIIAGNTQQEATRIFGLNKATVNRWYMRYRKEGHYRARRRNGLRSNVDIELLKKIVSNNSVITLEEIGNRMKISRCTVYYWLIKLGYGYKKKPIGTWKLMKKEGENI